MSIKGKCNQNFYWFLLMVLSTTSFSTLNAQSWQSLGPGPLHFGQVEGITNGPVIGAIHGLATHPTNANIIYVATVNGGIWKTINATSANPAWIAQTDGLPSMSMSDVEFDTTDTTFQTLIAGVGRFSSLASVGGSRAGVFRTTDGGSTWAVVNGGIMSGKNISSVEARGSTLLAAVNTADNFSCANVGVFRSTNSGSSWSQLTSTQGVPRGAASALTADPSNNEVFYAGVSTLGGTCSALASGIYKTLDSGQSWLKVSDAAMEAIISTNSCHFEIAVGNNNNVFVSMVCTEGSLDGVFRSGNGGTSWTAMSLPTTTETSGAQGLHPGQQGSLHSSLVADPTNDNIVYVGGDRQPDGFPGVQFPNSIGANDYSGRLFRGDASQAMGSQWTPLTHSGTASNSSPHADSRELRFDVAGSLLEVDDGGIYRNNSPGDNTGDWLNVNGDMKVNEQHDTAYDNNSSIVISGNQDNGSSQQNTFSSSLWGNVQSGDGGDVVVDVLSQSGTNESIRYSSSQNLIGFNRLVYNQSNALQAQTLIALNVTSGAAFSPQFVTPLSINNINGNRLIIGGGNSVYESLDSGDNITEIGAGIVVRALGRNNIAYGATGSEEILYIGACQGDCGDNSDGADGVFVRSAGGVLTQVYPASGNGLIQGITINPNDPTEAFLIEDTQVMRTTDTGASWTNITGGLSDFGQIRSIIFMPNATNSGLAIGTNKGVFISRSTGGYSNWATSATGMPNSPVFDLQYDDIGDRLVAGTMGRGAFALTGILSDNTPPTAGSDTINIAKGGTATTLLGGFTSVLNNDSDPDVGDSLTVTLIPTTLPTNGLVTLSANGTFSYQHDNSFTQTDKFFYQVCDDGTPIFCADGQVDINIDLGPNAICRFPNIDIPDGNSAGIDDILTVAQTGAITDLNVAIEINHTWVGDLEVTLTDASSGTSVVLIQRPGANACSNNDISVVLDDEAASQADDQCLVTPPAIGGTFKPTAPLASFNGVELSGNWSLKVADFVAVDTGALISWCLEATVAGSAAPVLDSIGNKSVNELVSLGFTATATDSDTSQANLTFSLSASAPLGASITTAGVFDFTPTEEQGPNSYTFDVIVTDDTTLTDTETITIAVSEVNQTPVLASIGNKTAIESILLSFTVTATDNDIPSQALTYSLLGEPAGAVITTGGVFSFTPTALQTPGSFTFDIIVTDDGPGQFTSSETITVTVTTSIFNDGFESL